MAEALPVVELEDIGPEVDSEAVRRADRAPSDQHIRGVYAKLNYKLESGSTFSQLRSNNVLPKFQTGNNTSGIRRKGGLGVKWK